MYSRIYLDLSDTESYGEELDWQTEALFNELIEGDYYFDKKENFYQFKEKEENRTLFELSKAIEKGVKKQKERKKELDSINGEMIEEKRRYLRTLDRITLSMNSVIVRAPILKCQDEHTVKDMAGRVLLTDTNGEVREDLVPIKYCLDEDVYFMLDIDYYELKRRGKILCRIITYKDYATNGIKKSGWDQLEPESKLRMMGYTVAKHKGLLPEQRHRILEGAIAYGIMTKDEVVSFLRWNYRQHITQHPHAAQKYIDDIEYLQYLDIEKKEVIDIDEIIE